MAILVLGKTLCPICKNPILNNADCIGLPNSNFPKDIDYLRDSCVHRKCIDLHPQKMEIKRQWVSQWTVDLALTSGGKNSVANGIALARKRQLLFVAFNYLIEIEESKADIKQLLSFFELNKHATQSELVLSWNTYSIKSLEQQVSFVVRSNSKNNLSSLENDVVVVSVLLTLDEWSDLAQLAVDAIQKLLEEEQKS